MKTYIKTHVKNKKCGLYAWTHPGKWNKDDRVQGDWHVMVFVLCTNYKRRTREEVKEFIARFKENGTEYLLLYAKDKKELEVLSDKCPDLEEINKRCVNPNENFRDWIRYVVLMYSCNFQVLREETFTKTADSVDECKQHEQYLMKRINAGGWCIQIQNNVRV